MELTNNFTVVAPMDKAWQVLLDVERVARCMPGATLDGAEGDAYKGHVKVKVGPIVVTYRGTAKFVEVDEAAHRAVIDASGKESRGSGTAKATVTTHLEPQGERTQVSVVTDLAITGRPAQFGRGVIADVATKLTEQFADNLAAELAGGGAAEASANGAPEAEAGAADVGRDNGQARSAPAAGATKESEDVIDLFGVSASPVLKRLAPIAAALGLGVVLVAILRRRRTRRPD